MPKSRKQRGPHTGVKGRSIALSEGTVQQNDKAIRLLQEILQELK